jgi:NTE family protein
VVAFEAPDVLVLGGGGILGEAWMLAVLVGLREAAGFDARDCDAFVGTSAGSIVAAALVAGADPRDRLGDLPQQPAIEDAREAADAYTPARVLQLATAAGRAAAAPVAALGLRAAEPGGALFRRVLLARVPEGRRRLGGLGEHLERAGARWDGRLAVAAVDRDSGRRVMFGTPGAPAASVGAAVEASCAIPGVFRPVEIGGRRYVDGGAWSPTNMDAAPAGRGSSVLCLNPTGALRIFGALSRTVAEVELLALERRGANVRIVAPDRGSMAAMGANLMDPRPRPKVVGAGMAQGRILAQS